MMNANITKRTGKLNNYVSKIMFITINCRSGVDTVVNSNKESTIVTTSNTAYEMTKLGEEQSGHEYEVIDRSPGPPAMSGGGVEVLYEMPSAPPSHQPLPAIPLIKTTPTGGDVGVAEEENSCM